MEKILTETLKKSLEKYVSTGIPKESRGEFHEDFLERNLWWNRWRNTCSNSWLYYRKTPRRILRVTLVNSIFELGKLMIIFGVEISPEFENAKEKKLQ